MKYQSHEYHGTSIGAQKRYDAQHRRPASTSSRYTVRNKSNQPPSKKTTNVAASKKAHPFSVQSYAGAMDVKPAPSARAFSPRLCAPSDFRYFYERGDFPITIEHDTSQNKIAWKVSFSSSFELK